MCRLHWQDADRLARCRSCRSISFLDISYTMLLQHNYDRIMIVGDLTQLLIQRYLNVFLAVFGLSDPGDFSPTFPVSLSTQLWLTCPTSWTLVDVWDTLAPLIKGMSSPQWEHQRKGKRTSSSMGHRGLALATLGPL